MSPEVRGTSSKAAEGVCHCSEIYSNEFQDSQTPPPSPNLGEELKEQILNDLQQ